MLLRVQAVDHNDKNETGFVDILVSCSLKGLLRISDNDSSVQVLVNRHPDGQPLSYVNDVAVLTNHSYNASGLETHNYTRERLGHEPGTIFFTSSATGATALDASGFYDTMRSFMLNLLHGEATGRLLAYNPRLNETKQILSGLFFANGVALAADESFIAIVETSGRRVLRYWLAGELTGTMDELIGGLPAFPDGIFRAPDGNFWVSLVAPVTPLLFRFAEKPWARQIFSHVLFFSHLFPPLANSLAAPFGCVAKVSPTGEARSSHPSRGDRCAESIHHPPRCAGARCADGLEGHSRLHRLCCRRVRRLSLHRKPRW